MAAWRIRLSNDEPGGGIAWQGAVSPHALECGAGSRVTGPECGSGGAEPDLRREFERNGNGEAFRCFELCLQGDPDATRRGEMARVLGLSVGAVQVALTRARHRYAELLREVVLPTVASPAEVSEEIRHLQSVLRG
jgi:hypothetical protein